MNETLSKKSMRPALQSLLLWSALGLLAVGLATQTPLAKRASQEIPAEPFRHVYVQSKIGSEAKCLVTDRSGATARRSEPDLLGARWKCGWLDGPDGPVLTALTGKEPSYIFIPELAVADPALPFLYEAIRKSEQLPLPRIRWVHLFHNRGYRGFYLQIRLPDKKLTTRLEMGRGEILETREMSASCWNRKLEPSCLLWSSSFIAEAIFPRPEWSPGTSLLNDLLQLSGQETRSFVLAELAPSGGHLWPWMLPVDLSRQLAPSRYDDRRYLEWLSPSVPGLDRDQATTLELPTVDWIRETLTGAVRSSRSGGLQDLVQRLDRSPSLAWLGGVPDEAPNEPAGDV